MSTREVSLFSHTIRSILPKTLVVMTVVSAATIWWVWSDAIKQAETRHKELTGLVIEQVTAKLRNIADQASTLAGNDLIINGLMDATARENYLPTFFRSLDVPGAQGAQISLTDYRGRIVVSNFGKNELQSRRAEWLDIVIGAHGFYQRLDERGLLVAMPVTYGGFTEGAIIIEHNAAQVATLFDLSGFSTAAALVGPKDVVIFSSEPKLTKLGDKLDPALFSGWHHLHHELPLLKNIILITAEPISTALAPLYNTLFMLIPSMLIVIALAIASTASAAMITSKEVGRLSNTLLELGKNGVLFKPIEPDGPAEMRSLSKSFNLMLEKLSKTTTSQTYLNSVISSVEEILIVVNQNGIILTANPSARKFITDQRCSTSASMASILCLNSKHDFLNTGTNVTAFKKNYLSNTDKEVWIQWRRSTLRDEIDNSKITGMIITGTDITLQHNITQNLRENIAQKEALENELRMLALTDPLTGLANRRAFLTQVNREFSNADRSSNDLGLLYIDIDHFKQINDRYGHAAGDEALKRLGDCLNIECRQGDLSCRLGGEEFAVLFCNFSPPSAQEIAERFRKAIANLEIEFNDTSFRMTASIGMVVRKAGEEDAETIMQKADAALYFAKRNGRNRVATTKDVERLTGDGQNVSKILVPPA